MRWGLRKVEDLDVRTIPLKCAHIVLVAIGERGPQQRRRRPALWKGDLVKVSYPGPASLCDRGSTSRTHAVSRPRQPRQSEDVRRVELGNRTRPRLYAISVSPTSTMTIFSETVLLCGRSRVTVWLLVLAHWQARQASSRSEHCKT